MRSLLLLAILLIRVSAAEFTLTTFSADVTVPVGHGMMGGAWLSKSVADPLFAKGFVFAGDGFEPVVFVAIDLSLIHI